MKFYFIAIVMLAAATLMEFTAKNLAGSIARQIAVLSQLQPSEHEAARKKLNIKAAIRNANVLEALAALAAIAGIGSWIASRRKRERGTQVIPIVLICAFVMMVLILV